MESFSHTDRESWERFLFELISSKRISYSTLGGLIGVLPSTLARTELRFSVIAQDFNVNLYNPDKSELVSVSVALKRFSVV